MKLRLSMFLAFMCMMQASFAQTRQLSGKVTGDKNSPLISANVIVKGASSKALTNSEGVFSVTVPSGNAVLEVSSLGYVTKQVKVAGNVTNVDVSLEETQDNSLQDVVVTALGITKQTRNLSYSVTQLKGDRFTDSRTPNLGNALSGKVAGVLVTPPASGIGGSTRIVIRGGSSLQGNDQPLYVINGVPMESANQGTAGLWGGNDAGDGLTAVNPDDIESLSVLKGNTAAALYGARAANGVILITTKSGKSRKGMGVSFNSNTTMDQAVDLYDFQKEYGQGIDGKKPATAGESLSAGLNNWGEKYGNSSTPQFDGSIRPYRDLGQSINDFYRTGINTTNSLAFSGGNQNGNYRFSVADLRAEDIMPNASFKRQTFNWNVNSKFDNFTLAFTGQYMKQKAKNRPRLSDTPGNGNFTTALHPEIIPFSVIAGATGKGDMKDGTELRYQPNVYSTNPYWAANSFFRQDDIDRLLGNVSLKYDFTKWLYMQGRVGTDYNVRDDASYTGYGTAYSTRGDYYQSYSTTREDNYDLIIGANKEIKDFSIDAIIGANAMYRVGESKGGGGGNLVVPFLHSVTNVATTSFSYGFNEQAINSYFGSANISYKNYLNLSLTGRQDEFSTLAKGSNTLFYPSAGLSFVLSDAFKLPEVISFGKLRTSWAQVGGGAPSPYLLGLNYELVGMGHLGANLGQIKNGSIPNSGLQPYTSSEIEFGADFRFLQNRFGLDITYYNRKTTNDILSTGISATSGFGSTIVNIGELENNGIELLLNAVVMQNKDFKWDVSFNYAQNISEVINLGKNSKGEPIKVINLDETRLLQGERIQHIVGKPLGYIIGYKQKTTGAGVKVYDADGYPVKTAAAEAIAVGRHPISGGFNNTFKYKNWKLDMLIDFRQGGSIVSATNYYAYAYGRGKETLEGRSTGLVVKGADESGANKTWNIAKENVDNFYRRHAQITENIVYDASFGKLRQLALSYAVPAKFLAKTKLENLTFSLVGRNLALLWSNVPNIDPESGYSSNGGSQGLEYFAMPQTRSFGFNLSVNF
jgi:TonB-linked SusC/RagA family outer membrane protein